MSVGGGVGGGNGGGSSSSSSLIGCSGVGLESRKWACEYCTYENWPASKRCTLCHAPRPPHLITDTVNEDQDIYKMADLVRPNNSEWCAGEGSSSGSSAGGGGSNKWACHLCTFLNWPRAARCTQCLTPRRKSSPTQSKTALQPANINITGSGTAVSSSSSSSTGSMRTTPKRNSPSSPEAAKAINNDINKTVATIGKSASSITPSSHSNKWACRVCTYENWPRSSKCVICGTSRGRTLSDSTIYLPGSQTASSTALSPGSTGVSGLSSAMGGAGSEQQEVVRRQGRASPSSPRSPDTVDPNNQDLAGASVGGAGTSSIDERKLKLLRKRLRDKDWLWLNACHGVVDGDPNAIEAFIAAGGNPSRQLTADELLLLARPSAFEVGHTLVHLALRFRREDMLAVLLAATDAAAKAVKRLPCHASPDLASDIRREIASSLRQRKGDFPCYFFTDCVSFALPADIEDLPRHIQEQLFDELLDRGVQNELEVEENIINWSVELTERLGSRLYALWNRTAGDCLLDSVLQATWGVFDVDNTLRRALADSLNEGAMTFYPRWKEYESKQAESLHFSLDEYQWQRDWAVLLSLASQPGASLEQTHIFALAHILRRPVIVYGVKYVKSFRGETLGLAKFQGVYLPFLWERSFCWKTPVALGYTRGHFSALVSMEMDLDEGEGAGANLEGSDEDQVAYLPLVDCEGKLLELHFLSGSEVGREELLLREWMDCYVTKGGLLVAVQRRVRQPTAVKQMVDEWLDRYRQLATTQASPASNQHTISAHNFSSDGESDQE